MNVGFGITQSHKSEQDFVPVILSQFFTKNSCLPSQNEI